MKHLLLLLIEFILVSIVSSCGSHTESRSARIAKYKSMGKEIIDNDIDSTIVFISGDTVYIDDLETIREVIIPSKLIELNLIHIDYKRESKSIDFDKSTFRYRPKSTLLECSVKALGRFGLEFRRMQEDDMSSEDITCYYIYSFSRPDTYYYVENRQLASDNYNLVNGYYKFSYQLNLAGLIDSKWYDDWEGDWYEIFDKGICETNTLINLRDGTMSIDYIRFVALNQGFSVTDKHVELGDYLSSVADKLNERRKEIEKEKNNEIVANALTISDIELNKVKAEHYLHTTQNYRLKIHSIQRSYDSKRKYLMKDYDGNYFYTNDESFTQLNYPCSVIISAVLRHIKSNYLENTVFEDCQLLLYSQE